MRVGVSRRSNSGLPSSMRRLVRTRDVDELADERVAVGMRAGGGEADHDVAGLRAACRR